jgi:hypothetical protein
VNIFLVATLGQRDQRQVKEEKLVLCGDPRSDPIIYSWGQRIKKLLKIKIKHSKQASGSCLRPKVCPHMLI